MYNFTVFNIVKTFGRQIFLNYNGGQIKYLIDNVELWYF